MVVEDFLPKTLVSYSYEDWINLPSRVRAPFPKMLLVTSLIVLLQFRGVDEQYLILLKGRFRYRKVPFVKEGCL